MHHECDFSFMKGTESALIEIAEPADQDGGRPMALELAIRTEVNPATMASRLLHDNNIDRLIGSAGLHARLIKAERKLAQRSRFSGALGFQFYRLWRAVVGPKRKSR
jgi:hypothetical protein